MHKANAHEHTGSAEAVRPSLRNGFTAYNALSSVTGLSCHRRSREAIASQELDTSVGVSGPHDFAVRIGALVSRAAASIASQSNVHDDREAPLLRAGMARAGSADLPDDESEIFFGRGLDRILVICPTGSAQRPHRWPAHRDRRTQRPGIALFLTRFLYANRTSASLENAIAWSRRLVTQFGRSGRRSRDLRIL
jgi:hypothetical protein